MISSFSWPGRRAWRGARRGETAVEQCEEDFDTLAVAYALEKGTKIGDLILIEVEIFCPERLDEFK